MFNKQALLTALSSALSIGSGMANNRRTKTSRRTKARSYPVSDGNFPRNRKTTTAARQKRAAIKSANKRKHPRG